MINFGQRVVRPWRWTAFKAIKVKKNLLLQLDDDTNTYTVYGYDGPEVHVCTIWIGDPPDNVIRAGYTAEQNIIDRADFEANYKSTVDGPLEARTNDGRIEIRQTTAKRTTNFNLRPMSFYTATSGSIHNMNPVTDADWGDVVMHLYDASGSLVSDPTMSGSVVKTIVDWEPHYNYEIIGGYMDIPAILKEGTTDQWFMAVIGVPDLPPQYYGSVPYISEINLESVPAQRITSNGRAISYLPYKYGGYPTNKLRFIIKHPAGAKARFQLYMEHFV